MKIQMLSVENCNEIINELNTGSGQWVHQQTVHPAENSTPVLMSHYKCIFSTLPEGFRAWLLAVAPDYDGMPARNVVIVRYFVGDYIPPHVDFGNFTHLITVPLQSGPDGITVNNVYYADEAGMGIYVNRNKDVHSVGPVNAQRYSLLFLYGENADY